MAKRAASGNADGNNMMNDKTWESLRRQIGIQDTNDEQCTMLYKQEADKNK